jgi:hypothetical protein
MDFAAGLIGFNSTFGAGRAAAEADRSLVVAFATGAADLAMLADFVVPFFTENLVEEFPTALEGFPAGFAPLLLAEGFLVGALATDIPQSFPRL